MFKKLSDIKPGTKAIIRSFTENELYVKLMEMGCVPGEMIQVENVAPFKDPISVLVSGYRLSLRLEEAENIVVEEII